MYFTDLISAIVLAAGSTTSSLAYLVPCNISYGAGAFMPLVIFRSWQQAGADRDGTIRTNYLVRASFLGGLLFSVALWLPIGIRLPDLLHLAIGVYDLMVLLLGFALFRFSALTPQMRLCRAIARNAATVGLLSLMCALLLRTRPVASILCFLVQQIALLLAILASFIFFTRFRDADVFATRSVRAIALTLFAIAALSLVQFLSLTLGWSVFGTTLIAVCLASFFSVALAAIPRLDAWVIRRMLFQPDWRAMIESISQSLQSLQTERELIDCAESRLAAALSALQVRIVAIGSLDEGQSARLDPLGDIVERRLQEPGADYGAEFLIPVAIDDSINYVIVIRLTESRRTFLSGEVQFLRAMARIIGTQMRRIETADAQRRQELRETTLRSQVSDAELRALRAQINPHFLFNSLNTIADLVVTSPADAERMTLRLASVFRHVLNQSDRQLISLREEFEFLRNYALIEQERFGKRLSVNFMLAPEAADAVIPTLLLQPLLENSVKHGIAPKKTGGRVDVRARRVQDAIEIQIEDDGVGYQPGLNEAGARVPDLEKSSGVGLKNTEARLRTTYGNRASIHVVPASPSGCRVSIVIPANGGFACAV
jgi:two-component system LytT family sensor kinase